MEKSKEINMKLPALDDLFSTQEERDEVSRESVRNLPLNEISDFPNHPFKVKMDESMSDLVDSIREHGVLVPALVRPKEDGTYEMVAGHRRIQEYASDKVTYAAEGIAGSTVYQAGKTIKRTARTIKKRREKPSNRSSVEDIEQLKTQSIRKNDYRKKERNKVQRTEIQEEQDLLERADGGVAALILIVVVLFGGVLCLVGGGNANAALPVSAEVEAYEPLIRQYATQHGISEYVELIKAVMMQESGGNGYISWAKRNYGGYTAMNAAEFSDMMAQRMG